MNQENTNQSEAEKYRVEADCWRHIAGYWKVAAEYMAELQGERQNHPHESGAHEWDKCPTKITAHRNHKRTTSKPPATIKRPKYLTVIK